MPSQVENSLALYFSSNSMRHTVITGTGVSYEITTPPLFQSWERITTVTRVDREGKKVVGEIVYRGNKLRLPGSSEWVRTRDFLKKPNSAPWYSQYVLPDLYHRVVVASRPL